MVDTFHIGDPHFWHKNIIEYCNRPYESAKQMNENIIDIWNSTISRKDKVFIHGDFSFCDIEETQKLVDCLNGYKILIMGNHDRWKIWRKINIEEVCRYPILYDNKYILSHQPIKREILSDFYNIHAHLHNSDNLESDKYFNVSIENIVKPIRFSVIKKGFEKLEA